MPYQIILQKGMYDGRAKFAGRFAAAVSDNEKIIVPVGSLHYCRESLFSDVRSKKHNLVAGESAYMVYRTKGAPFAKKLLAFLKNATKLWTTRHKLPEIYKEWLILKIDDFWTPGRIGFLTVLMRMGHMTKKSLIQAIKSSKYCRSKSFRYAMILFVRGHHNLSGIVRTKDYNVVDGISRMKFSDLRKDMKKSASRRSKK